MSDDLKEVRPFMALAETLESSNPIISYYLKKYCIQKAHAVYVNLRQSKPQNADQVFQQLNQWMPAAYQLSKQLQGQIDQQANMAEILDYTERLFLTADNDYRSKNFSPDLTQNFMACGRLYEVIKQFASITEDQEKRMKYAKVKAVEVHKALKSMPQPSNDEPYKPEPVQFTPGGPKEYAKPPAFTPEVPHNQPSSGQGNYPTMSGFHMPTIPTMAPNDFGFQDFGQPVNSPPKDTPSFPAFNQPSFPQASFGQPSLPSQPFPQQQSTYPQQQTYPQQPQQPTYPQQPSYQPQQPLTNQTSKKRMDPYRIAAQNQATSQLQNAISYLSFNRCTQAKYAIRNAMKLLEKYE